MVEIPCFRCGVCCIKWQPLLSPPELRQLAADLGISLRSFKARYTRPYPPRRGWRQLKTGDIGCIFLSFHDGRAACTIHPVRPQVCREWAPGLDRRECVEGLRAFPGPPLLPLADLYPQCEDRREFVRAAEGTGRRAEEQQHDKNGGSSGPSPVPPGHKAQFVLSYGPSVDGPAHRPRF